MDRSTRPQQGNFCPKVLRDDDAPAAPPASTSAVGGGDDKTPAQRGNRRAWPGLTKKGEDCSLCLSKGSGIFCHHHDESAGNKAKSQAEAKAEAPARRRAWPALTAKGVKCSLCLKKGEGIFCHHHQE